MDSALQAQIARLRDLRNKKQEHSERDALRVEVARQNTEIQFLHMELYLLKAQIDSLLPTPNEKSADGMYDAEFEEK